MATNISTIAELWACLTDAEVEDSCLCLFRDTSEHAHKLVSIMHTVLAREFRFRAEYFRRKSSAEVAQFIRKRRRHPCVQFYAEEILYAWMKDTHQPLCIRFLDAAGIEHEGGRTHREPPDAEEFACGYRAILKGCDPRSVGLFLAYYACAEKGGAWRDAMSAGLEDNDVDVLALISGDGVELPVPDPEPTTDDQPERQPEDSDAFTTLDEWLIRTAVASAFGEQGALSQEKIEDLVDEVVELNSQRQHTLFHRGYLHALFDKPFAFHFPGENEVRRLWYFTGVIFGLLRHDKRNEALELLKEHAALVNSMIVNSECRCGGMLLPQLQPILWEAEEYGLLLNWLKGQFKRMPMGHRVRVLAELHDNASVMVRQNNWAEATGFFSFMEGMLTEADAVPGDFGIMMRPHLFRRQAQIFQLSGDFFGAELILRGLTMAPDPADVTGPFSDLGLIRGGFRSLAAVLPTKDPASGQTTVGALREGEEFFQSAIDNDSASATNAHFCMGLIHLFTSGKEIEAVDALESALAGMIKKEEAYTEGNIIQWNRFLLGIARLESIDESGFRRAQDLIRQSIKTPVAFPMWLWERTVHAAAMYDEKALATRIANHLLESRGTDAYKALWSCGLVRADDSLRKTYLAWLMEAPLQNHEKWVQLQDLLPAALRCADPAQGETVLDAMESMAMDGEKYRRQFVSLLEDDQNFSPIWTTTEAEDALIRFYERDNESAKALALLRSRFHRCRQDGGPRSQNDAEAVLEQMEAMSATTEDLQQLQMALDATSQDESEDVCADDACQPVRILYIGGNETQQAYEGQIKSELAVSHPHLSVEFYYPGWDSNWSRHLDAVKPQIDRADCVVLNTLVRTQFGRSVRKYCGSDSPWLACTGRGRDSLKRSIIHACRFASSHDL